MTHHSALLIIGAGILGLSHASAAARRGLKVKVFAVSADLPFAQARWCGAAGAGNVVTLSDHASMGLADALGIHIKELRLLARTVFIVNAAGKIAYRQIVGEVASEPNYDDALGALTKLL